MPEQREPTGYAKLVQKVAPPPPRETKPEEGLDALLTQFQVRRAADTGKVIEEAPKDPIEQLRDAFIAEYIPIFAELTGKYAKSGVSMEMDVSNLLQGGREIRMVFGIGDCRTELHGTATSEAIAFRETRYKHGNEGELASGPLIRLRRLNPASFREFVCNQLAIIVRAAMRRM